jgi:hypothetical protein
VIVFWDESGASLLPVTRRSWAPCGNTPVVRHHFNWKRCSMAAAICYGSHAAARRWPELNPVEGLWASLKGVVELANLAGDTLDEVTAAAERGIQRIRSTHWLAFSFLRHCGLPLW